MPRLPRPRYADVTATLALVIALGTGGAYAATSLVSTGQIANGAVTTAKIHNNAVTSGKLAPSIRSKLSQPVFAPWSTIPAGKTVTGRFYDDWNTTATTSHRVDNITLPAKAPAAINQSDILFGTTAGGTTKSPLCTGSAAQPTAPRGKVCIYVVDATGVNVYGYAWEDSAQRPYTFYLWISETSASSDVDYWGSWAYTAP